MTTVHLFGNHDTREAWRKRHQSALLYDVTKITAEGFWYKNGDRILLVVVSCQSAIAKLRGIVINDWHAHGPFTSDAYYDALELLQQFPQCNREVVYGTESRGSS